ncbi:MAG: site-specific DNA-methyltransferase [Candidatus Eremiobacteraeota bacterium]|nr:site-specific DNA-methyltransferase [Candidatus Eremiobacteraeota bacterium]
MTRSASVQPFQLIAGDATIEAARVLPGGSVDLILTDPPYGIEGDLLHRHYNRDERFVTPGYVEVPQDRYNGFSREWIAQAERVLRPGGQLYVVSGYSNLYDVLDALRGTSLHEINHIIWKYNFGVFTRAKYVSSHYHILYYAKPGGVRTFNAESRFTLEQNTAGGGSANYRDREDVWIINREYKPGREKNKNELPRALLTKIVQYSSNPGDHVVDFFAGSGSTGVAALELGRRFTGFELSEAAARRASRALVSVEFGAALENDAQPKSLAAANRGKRWSEADATLVQERYRQLRGDGNPQKHSIERLAKEFGRGTWAIRRVLRALRQPASPTTR